MDIFDARTELAELRRQTAEIRRRRYTKSRLDRYRGQLIQLRRNGASVAELQRWLRDHRIRVAHSTVARWVTKNADPADAAV